MKFRVYATRHACLIVPDCMQASQAAVHRYGPLELLGEVDQHDLAESEVARIMKEVDDSSFAALPAQLGGRLQRALVREHA